MRSFKSKLQKKDFHKHHLIPVAIFNSQAFQPLFSRIRCIGFDPQDFATNGIWLPCTELMAIHTSLPLHRGPHPHYNDLVSECVAAVSGTLFGNEIPPQNVIKTAKEIHRLQGRLRRELVWRNPQYNLSSRDPRHGISGFTTLERDITGLSYARYLS
jgi:A nuclease family of the HNH/ENDO VII superfamily with conserved AHH